MICSIIERGGEDVKNFRIDDDSRGSFLFRYRIDLGRKFWYPEKKKDFEWLEKEEKK